MSDPAVANTALSGIARLGIGTWQLGGPNYVGNKPTGWGAVDETAAIRAIHRALDEGVRFIDTADSYGPYVSEELIAETLHPYDNLVVATKGRIFDSVRYVGG